jgi:hypothetical protein
MSVAVLTLLLLMVGALPPLDAQPAMGNDLSGGLGAACHPHPLAPPRGEGS